MSKAEEEYHLVEFINDDHRIVCKCKCGWKSYTGQHIDPDVLRKYATTLESRHLKLTFK